MRRLRVAHIVIQPVLVWDDGEELHPGPPVQAQQVAPSAVADMLTALAGEIAILQAEADWEQPVCSTD